MVPGQDRHPERAPTDLYYEIVGQGRPIVLCHALGTQLALWQEPIRRLRAECRFLAYDLPGHGRSPAAAGGDYSFAAQVAGLVALMDRVGMQEAAVCGISVGGEIAQALAAACPGRVERLLLVSTACYTGEERAALWRGRIREVEETGMDPVARSAVGRWFTRGFAARCPEVVEHWRQVVARTAPSAYVGIARAIAAMDLRPGNARIRCPTRVAVGSEDTATGPAAGREIAASIPGAGLEVLEGASHLWPLEQPERFERMLRDWLGLVSSRSP